MDYLVIGAGPAGLQLGYFLERAGRDYLVVEAGPAPRTFFKQIPSAPAAHLDQQAAHRLGRSRAQPAHGLEFAAVRRLPPALHRYTGRYLPDADDMVRYLADFADAFHLRVRYDTQVVRVSRQDGAFRVTDEQGRIHEARRLVVATGVSAPYLPPIPGIETAELYGTVSVDPGEFMDQRVLVIGKGNSGFETAGQPDRDGGGDPRRGSGVHPDGVADPLRGASARDQQQPARHLSAEVAERAP